MSPLPPYEWAIVLAGLIGITTTISVVLSRGGQRITKEHNHSTRKIDLAIAAVMAVDRAATAAPAYNILDSVW
jgi:hypothetical protein